MYYCLPPHEAAFAVPVHRVSPPMLAGIDAEFEHLLDAIFGVDAMKSFKRKRPADWICLLAAFESRKRAANPLSPTPLNIPLPFSFIEFYRKHTV